jgi:hypothetical protein
MTMTSSTLSRTALLVVLVAAGVLFTPRPAAAQATAIHNLGRETVKVCVYNANDGLKLAALRCWTLKPDQVGSWSRNTGLFSAIVYRPGLLDEFLCQGDRLSTSLYITQPCRIHTSDPRPVDARLRVCNEGYSQGVNFVIAYLSSRAQDEHRRPLSIHSAEGWWHVENGKCVEIALDTRWPGWYRTALGANRGGSTGPELFIYGETPGIIQRVWEGSNRSLSFCVNESKGFRREQVLARDEPCRGLELGHVRMLRVTEATWYSARSVRFTYTF